MNLIKNKKTMPKGWLLFFAGSFVVFYSHSFIICASDAGEPHIKGLHHSHHHKAYHGGVLNVIGNCETGHIEIRLEFGILKAWLVGGGHDTNRSVVIDAKEMSLSVQIPGQRPRNLNLKADPMKLAGEKIGHCSRFIGKADWLKDVGKFEARGELVFKGIRYDLLINYPEGYDPGHNHKGK